MHSALLITIGAKHISAVLGKCSLQILEISFNDIGDDGITAIAEALGNSQISELTTINCGITLIGARSLAAGLLVNNSVRKVEIQHNSITVEGARLILQSAVDNGNCLQILLDTSYERDYEVQKMIIKLLEHGKKQKVGRCVI